MSLLYHHIKTYALILLVFISCFAYRQANAQELPPNQPEQDACNALSLCGNRIFHTPYSYVGAGQKNDLLSTPCSGSATEGGEQNVVWLKIVIAASGKLVFKIIPVAPGDDYDFAVLNITNTTCDNLSPLNVVRCNFNNNAPGSNAQGIIGLSTTSNTRFVENGSFGSSYCQAIDALAGDTYLIMINNFGDYFSSNGISAGFSIDFAGSTTFVNTNNTSSIQSARLPCGYGDTVVVQFDREILCSSVAPDGSDFSSDAPAKITGAYASNCRDLTGYTKEVRVAFSSFLPKGTYRLQPKQGSDGNTWLNLCGDDVAQLQQPFLFTVEKPLTEAVQTVSICNEQLPYIWNDVAVFNGGSRAAVYRTRTAGGCDSVAVLNLVVGEPVKSATLTDIICSDSAYRLPWDSAVSTSGTFTHLYKNKAGCDSLTQHIILTGDASVSVRTDTGFCTGSSVVLTARDGFSDYVWSTGEASQRITSTREAIYIAQATNANNCLVHDTFSVVAYRLPSAMFGVQTALCDDSPKEIDAGGGFTSYLWSNGSNSQKITVSETGIYRITLTDDNQCTATDSIRVIASTSPVSFLPADIVKCSYDDALLQANASFATYLWSSGSHDKSVIASQPGWYWLEVTNTSGCIGRDSVLVSDSACAEFVSVPSAFSPDGNGLNDLFRPIVRSRLAAYWFIVYDRWGNIVFSTADKFKGWDGSRNGSPQPAGTYIWVCKYNLTNERVQVKKGTMTLLR